MTFKSLGVDVEVSEEELDDCKEFVRTVCRGKADESHIQTRISLYIDQKINSKSTLTIPTDRDSCTQLFYRAHYQAFIWDMCICWLVPYIIAFRMV